jgi:hypothetical protein
VPVIVHLAVAATLAAQLPADRILARFAFEVVRPRDPEGASVRDGRIHRIALAGVPHAGVFHARGALL